MASKTSSPTATSTVNPVASLPVTTETTVTIAELQASRKAIEDQIKALKAAQPKRDSLQAEIAKQTGHPTLALVHSLGAYARARVRLGQSGEQAKADLLELCALLIDAGLAKANEPEPAAETDQQ